MSDISQVVFASTPRGFEAMRGGGDHIPLELKTVLTLVDGVCPVAQYIPFLQTFAPLEPKFLELEKRGFLQRLGEVSVSAVRRFENLASTGQAASELPRIDAESRDSGFSPLLS